MNGISAGFTKWSGTTKQQTHIPSLPPLALSSNSLFEALRPHITLSEMVIQMVDESYHQHQRKEDSKFIVVEDHLVGKEGDWVTVDDGELKLKQQSSNQADDPPLEDKETAITSNKSCAEWTDPNDPCLNHPGFCHKRGECALSQQ